MEHHQSGSSRRASAGAWVSAIILSLCLATGATAQDSSWPPKPDALNIERLPWSIASASRAGSLNDCSISVFGNSGGRFGMGNSTRNPGELVFHVFNPSLSGDGDGPVELRLVFEPRPMGALDAEGFRSTDGAFETGASPELLRLVAAASLVHLYTEQGAYVETYSLIRSRVAVNTLAECRAKFGRRDVGF